MTSDLLYLAELDTVYIIEAARRIEVFGKKQVTNTYQIYSSWGKQIYLAADIMPAQEPRCCRKWKGVNTVVANANGVDLIWLHYPPPLCEGIQIFSQNRKMATVNVSSWCFGFLACFRSWRGSCYTIYDANDEAVLGIESYPIHDVDDDYLFNIYPANNRSFHLGEIRKTAGRFDDDKGYTLIFPLGLSPDMKAVLLVTSILINNLHSTGHNASFFTGILFK